MTYTSGSTRKNGSGKESLRLRSVTDAIAFEAELRKGLGKPAINSMTVSAIAEKYLTLVDFHQSPKTARDKRKMLFSQILPKFLASHARLPYQRDDQELQREAVRRTENFPSG
jgi:hypothetical protein